MTADEISKTLPWNEIDPGQQLAGHQVNVLVEIAAQLAELNVKLEAVLEKALNRSEFGKVFGDRL